MSTATETMSIYEFSKHKKLSKVIFLRLRELLEY